MLDRFVLVGVGSTLSHALIVVGLVQLLGTGPVRANGAAFVTCTAVTYLINTFWSFGQRPNASNLFRYLAVTLGGFGLSLGLSAGCLEAGLSYWWGIVAVVFIVPIWTYLMHANWTYKAADPGPHDSRARPTSDHTASGNGTR